LHGGSLVAADDDVAYAKPRGPGGALIVAVSIATTAEKSFSDRDAEAAAFGHVGGRRHRAGGVGMTSRTQPPSDQFKFFTIAEVAERLHVATRTVRRWIEADILVVHRVGGVVRIAEGDLRAFLALHREG
jgi:excisionase family DNA binding protein